MASRGIEMGLVMVLVTMLWAQAMAQSGCSSVLISMAPCLNYVSGSSSNPSSSCCSRLASVVKSQPQCLCMALNGGGAAALGVTINQTLALALPSVCNVQTPPVSQCNAAGGGPASSPVGSLEGSPGDSSNEIPAFPTSSSVAAGAGSKTVPSTSGAASDGNTMKMPVRLVGFLLFMASYASAFSSF